MSEKAIRRFTNEVHSRIQRAGLSPNDRKNMGRVLEKEVNLVFIDQKATAEERLKYWEMRQMDPATAAFMAEQAMNTAKANAEQSHYMEQYVRSKLPGDHVLTAAEGRMLTENMNPGQGVAENMVTFMAWVDHAFIPQVMRGRRETAQREAAQAQSRKESIAKANESLKRPVSEW